jgi:hypothetical protein
MRFKIFCVFVSPIHFLAQKHALSTILTAIKVYRDNIGFEVLPKYATIDVVLFLVILSNSK